MAFQGDSIFWVEVEKIVPNPFQPRREFDESKLKELAESVRMYGILQPLTVTRKEVAREDGAFFSEYELIAGERRLRASKLAGLAQVPVIIREGQDSEQEKLELAIIENLQREDLNAVDRALAFRQLADAFKLSHAQVAKKVGRSREYVSNTLRLLMLPDYMLESLKVADISEGHARTLLMLNDRAEEQDTVFREILMKKLSVREVERIVRKIATDKVRKKIWKGTDPGLIEIEKQFTESLGTRVQIAKTEYGGKISIDYFSEEDLTAILERLKSESISKAKVSESAIIAVTDEMEDINEEEREILDAMARNTPLKPVAEKVTAEPESKPEPELESVAQANLAQSRSVPNFGQNEQVDSAQPVVESPPEVKPENESMDEASNRPPRMSEDTTEIKQPETSEPTVNETEPESVEESLNKLADTVDAKPKDEDESDLYSLKNFSV